jgi:hypothetical protein
MAIHSFDRRVFASALMSVVLVVAAPAFAQTATPPKPGPDPANIQELQAEGMRFQARIDEAARAFERNARIRKFTPEQRRDLTRFVSANLLFALVHEVGHALISEMGLPVLGREEDAADAYAVLSLLRIGTDFTESVLIEAARSWFLVDERAQTEGIKASMYDRHGMDKQRAYQIVCLMVGFDADKFRKLASDVGMPEDRQDSCVGDYMNAQWSWDRLLKSHLRAAGQPKQKIDAVYRPGKGMFDSYAGAARTIRLLETIAAAESDRYVWRAPFTIEMDVCGSQDAHWDNDSKKILICYEVAADFASLYADYVILKNPSSHKQHVYRSRVGTSCPPDQLDVAAADAIRYYSGGEH